MYFYYTTMLQEAQAGSLSNYFSTVEDIYTRDNELFRHQMLPYHFVAATLNKIGGNVFYQDGSFGYILPGQNMNSATVRYYGKKPVVNSSSANLNLYDVTGRQAEDFPKEVIYQGPNGEIIHPDMQTAIQARRLQKQIWGITDDTQLYPFDLYNPHSGLATRLVARSPGGDMQGFLFGFYGRGAQWLGNADDQHEITWIESQLLGVDPSVRKIGLARLLKIQQLQEAQRQQIPLIHWTVDPLQFPNARLNYNALGGVAGTYYSDYYPVRNALNPLKTSRFGISWLTNSGRTNRFVQDRIEYPTYEELASKSWVELIDPIDKDGHQFSADLWEPQAPLLLIQIPSDWTDLLKTDLQRALEWRTVSDAIFSKTIGTNSGQYIVTGAIADKDKGTSYLIAHKNEGGNIKQILEGNLL